MTVPFSRQLIKLYKPTFVKRFLVTSSGYNYYLGQEITGLYYIVPYPVGLKPPFVKWYRCPTSALTYVCMT